MENPPLAPYHPSFTLLDPVRVVTMVLTRVVWTSCVLTVRTFVTAALLGSAILLWSLVGRPFALSITPVVLHKARVVVLIVSPCGSFVCILVLVNVLTTMKMHFGFVFDKVFTLLSRCLEIIVVPFRVENTLPVALTKLLLVHCFVATVATFLLIEVGAPGTIWTIGAPLGRLVLKAVVAIVVVIETICSGWHGPTLLKIKGTTLGPIVKRIKLVLLTLPREVVDMLHCLVPLIADPLASVPTHILLPA